MRELYKDGNEKRQRLKHIIKKMVTTKLKTILNLLKNGIKVLITGLVIAFLVEYFGVKGFIGFLCLAALFGLYKLLIYRDNFMETLRQVETIIWGKPLEKELWDKGELKNTKVKINWKRKKKLKKV